MEMENILGNFVCLKLERIAGKIWLGFFFFKFLFPFGL